MGEHRFRMPRDWQLEKRQASCIHVVGLDGIPWPCRVSIDEQMLVVARNRNESGKVFITYPFAEFGELTICTGTLPESDQPYHLMQELARGTLNRLRNQISIWREGGLEINSEIEDLTTRATQKLGAAILNPDVDVKDTETAAAIELAIQAIFAVSNEFSKAIAAYRVSQSGIAPFWFACSAEEPDQIALSNNENVFDLINVHPAHVNSVPDDHDQRFAKPVIVGPLLNAAAGSVQLASGMGESSEVRRQNLLDSCRETLGHCPSSTSLIHAVSGLNGTGHRHLSYPQQMLWASDVVRAVEDSAATAPVMVSFDFPWAERMASSVGGTHPLQIADALIRQGLPIAFLGLEVNLDYWPAGSCARDPLQWIDLADVWAQLDLPLVFCLRWPSLADPSATLDEAEPERGSNINAIRSGMTDSQRLDLLTTILPMLIARPSIHGVIFKQWADHTDPQYPHGGLFNDQSAKEIVSRLKQIRHDVLGRD